MQNAQTKSRKRLTVSGRSKQANIHTHGCNEVMLMWGSLRLIPIIYGPLCSQIALAQSMIGCTTRDWHTFSGFWDLRLPRLHGTYLPHDSQL